MSAPGSPFSWYSVNPSFTEDIVRKKLTLSLSLFVTALFVHTGVLPGQPVGPRFLERGILLLERTGTGIHLYPEGPALHGFDPASAGPGGDVPGDDMRSIRSWTSAHGPYGGYITGLTVDPQDPSTMYVGGMAFGLFKSTDAGETWLPKRNGIVCDWVNQIDVFPGNTNIVAAASFERLKWNEGDVYGSIDGGESWFSLGLEGIGWWRAVHLTRKDPRRILAGGEAGIYLSTDAGKSWSHRSGTTTAWQFTSDPSSPDTIYAGGGLGNRYRSTDGGESWSDFAQSIPSDNLSGVAVDPGNPNTIYCSAFSFPVADGTEGVYRSTDFGASWSHILTQNAWTIRIDPSNPEMIWAGGAGPSYLTDPRVWRSTNGGATWTQYELEIEHYFAPSVHVLEVDPGNGDEVYVGLYNAGVMRTTDGGSTWEDRSSGLSGTLMNCIAVHPSEPATIYAGTWQAELWKTTDGGDSWFWSSNGLDDINHSVMDVVVDPNDPGTLFMGADNSGIYRSTDGGNSWINVYPTYDRVSSVAISPHDSEEIWAGKIGGILKSVDGGDTWDNMLPGYATSVVAVSPFDPELVCAGNLALSGGDKVVISVSRNGGETWEERYTDSYGGMITSLTFSEAYSGFIYATSLNHNVIKSFDAGFTWIPDYGGFDPGGRIQGIAADPLRHNTVYAAVNDDRGFYASFDGGTTWYPFNDGLWVRSLITLEVNPLGSYQIFYTGTSGDGISYNYIRLP